MNDGLYIAIELGAGFVAIIAFLVTFLTSFRRWVLERIDRDIDPHLAKRDASLAKYARQARETAKQAAEAAKQAAEMAGEAREAALQAKHETRRLSGKLPDNRNADGSTKPGAAS
jgi:F0F1-type ATP synthase membrane subunit b/b'